MRLDAHQHFWKYNEVDYSWIKPDWPIRRNFLPADFGALLSAAGFDGSIAVQARQTLEETRWLLELAGDYPFIKGVVGWVDLCSERVEEQLGQFASNPKLAGIRHVVQDEPDDSFMLRPDFMRGIGRLGKFKLTYDLLIFPQQLPAAITLVSRFGDQPFVLDHIAKPRIREGTLRPWREQMFELAKSPNIMCKVSGMVTEAKWGTWQKADFQPYLEVVFEAFGFDRLMIGSDWPVCLLAANYKQAIDLVKEGLGSAATSAQQAVLGGNAERFYLRRQRNSK